MRLFLRNFLRSSPVVEAVSAGIENTCSSDMGTGRRGARRHDIVFVIGNLDGGGSQRVLVTLANRWAELGARICVITLADESVDRYTLHDRVTRVALGLIGKSRSPLSGILSNLKRVLKLREALRSADSHTIVSFLTVTNLLTILASVGLSVRVVISERNDPSRQVHGLAWRLLRRSLYRFADTVTANNKAVVQVLSAYVPSWKLQYIPNPMPNLARSVEQQEENQTILCVGRLSYQKAQDVLLNAFELITHQHPKWKLVLAGDGVGMETLQQQAKRLGVNDRVEWLGWTPDIQHYYALADIFVLPSRYEGTPNALLEAMGFGLAVIVTDSYGNSIEYIQDGITALVVPVEDSTALAHAIQRLVDDPNLRRNLGMAARQQISERHSRTALKAWEDLLQFGAVN